MLASSNKDAVSAANLARIDVSPAEKQAALDDPTGRDEEKWFKTQREQHEIDRLSLILLNLRNNISARKRFAVAIFGLVCAYLAVVLAIIILAGSGKIHLDNAVLLGLIGSGSANVIGVFHYVAKYLFNTQDGSPAEAVGQADRPKLPRPDRKAIALKPAPPEPMLQEAPQEATPEKNADERA